MVTLYIMPIVRKPGLSMIHKLVLEARLGISLLRLYSTHVLGFSSKYSLFGTNTIIARNNKLNYETEI